MKSVMLAELLLLAACATASAAPLYTEDWVIPRETFFNHAPCIVELPDGDLLISWYHGAKGNRDDDVMVEGARKPDGARSWGPRFVMADTPGYPDGNACMVLDSKGQLMFFWPTLLANSWVSAQIGRAHV
jgi:hypothetical protein